MTDDASLGDAMRARLAAKVLLVIVVCVALLVSGCDRHSDPGPLTAIVSPAIPLTAQELANPLRGQYEDLLEPLFPQVNNAQQRYPAWPASSDASLRVTWRQLQPTDPRTTRTASRSMSTGVSRRSRRPSALRQRDPIADACVPHRDHAAVRPASRHKRAPDSLANVHPVDINPLCPSAASVQHRTRPLQSP